MKPAPPVTTARMRKILRITLATALAASLAAVAGSASASPASGSFSLRYESGARSVRFSPPLDAASYIAIDAATGRVLVAHGDRARRPIASLTKIMTALLVLERGDLGREDVVPRIATRLEPGLEGLVQGHAYPRLVLLYSALMVSANDSAATLAYDAGDGSLPRFYREMTAKARSLGMTDTHYWSAAGLEDAKNYSSARDQALLIRDALQNPTFAKIVSTKSKTVRWAKPTYSKLWINHNRMLAWDPSVIGVKTGYTEKAGGCLAVAARRNGHTVILVLLHSNAIWNDGPRLLEKAFARLES